MAIDPIQFHLDEHVDPAMATALRRHGADVTTTNDVHLRTRTDMAHWEYAQRESRVIVTHDDDFLRLARQDERHAGIAYCRPKTRPLGEIIRRLIRLYDERSANQMMGQVIYL